MLSTHAHPLNQLLRKGVAWKWGPECQRAFRHVKAVLASAEVLAHYDASLPLKLDCDASAVGLGAVLSHVFPNGVERPIAYASRTLSNPEKNYSQIEKEGLALVWGVRKFHKYLYGRHFTLVTDHKPLLAILGEHRGLPTLAAARLQRWAVFLLGYQYTLEFRSTTKHCNADAFSRLPRAGTARMVEKEASAFNIHQLQELTPITPKQLAAATATDPVLSQVLRYCRDGWPTTVAKDLEPYHQKQAELGLEAGCVFRGTQVVIPSTLQSQVLQELHTSHPGIVRMKGLARWPGLTKAIENCVQGCDNCQTQRNQPPPVPLHPWPLTREPWERVHIDFAGPVDGLFYLILVDSYSKWIEIEPMRTTTTEKTVDILKTIFARYGLPRELVSDNGPQFVSAAFQLFMKRNGIRHARSAPYHPATNGAAERVVQTFKRSLRTAGSDSGSEAHKLARFLLSYRTTPHSTTGQAPAELFLRRNIHT